MTGFILRILAMATMLIDHIGWNFIDNPMLLTWIGRIAFPLYAFLLAEGFFFVFGERRRLLKHISTLLLLAVGSELCYDMLEFGSRVSSYMNSQSVMITLLLGFLGMIITELLIPSKQNENTRNVDRKNILVVVCAYLLLGFCNYKMGANFNLVGPWLILAYYWYLRYSRNDSKTENVWGWFRRFIVLIFIFLVYLPIYFRVRTGFGGFNSLIMQVNNYLPWVGGHFLAALILSFSNGKLGYHKKWFKVFYTLFYPVHAFIIGVIIILLGA